MTLLSQNKKKSAKTLGDGAYLSPLGIWALGFGCSVGWGSFVMPGTTFLPTAGPLGTVIGILIGTVIMLIIAVNYYHLMRYYPDAGGGFSYAKNTFHYDHGFICAWFLLLVYVAILCANVSALPLIFRSLNKSLFEIGFHYSFAGYEIYFGEILFSLIVLVLCGVICMTSKKFSAGVQIIAAIILIAGVIVIFGASEIPVNGDRYASIPQFAEKGTPITQICWIVTLMPWAFVGFESVTHSVEEITFPLKKTRAPIIFAVLSAGSVYIMLTMLAACSIPLGFKNWIGYTAALDKLDGAKGIPTVYAAEKAFGEKGLLLISIIILSAIVTGIVGNYIAASRLLYFMSKEKLLSDWVGRLDEKGIPRNALLFVMLISVGVSFLGRTAIVWIVDVATVGASVIYAYTSAAALMHGIRENKRLLKCTGALGLLFAFSFICFMVIPNFQTVGTLSVESYLILIVWSALGIIVFRSMFKRDKESRLGHSSIVWISLATLILITTHIWLRQNTERFTNNVSVGIYQYFTNQLQTNSVFLRAQSLGKIRQYLMQQSEVVRNEINRDNTIQLVLIGCTMIAIFSVYSIMSKRSRQAAIEKSQAQSRAKSEFLFNMSHDIRTPMNAVMGYTHLARQSGNDVKRIHEYLVKIDTSNQYMLSLLNDVLEMSRIETGQFTTEITDTDLTGVLENVYDLFANQMREKGLTYEVVSTGLTVKRVYCDEKHLTRIFTNLVSNAYKFTPVGGQVHVEVIQTLAHGDHVDLEIHVKDTGIGMKKEFVSRIFDAFERERTSTDTGLNGTGLGMAIIKKYLDQMDATITVETKPQNGTEFIIWVSFPVAERKVPGQSTEKVYYGKPELFADNEDEMDSRTEQSEKTKQPRQDMQEETQADKEQISETQVAKEQTTQDRTKDKIKLLLVEDNEINRDIAGMILEDADFDFEEAENGKIAVDRIAASEPGEFDAILMDIQMPVMNGLEASKAIRQLEDPTLSSIPIIAVTANAFAEDIQREKEAGMNAHVSKPINEEVLLTEIAKVLEK